MDLSSEFQFNFTMVDITQGSSFATLKTPNIKIPKSSLGCCHVQYLYLVWRVPCRSALPYDETSTADDRISNRCHQPSVDEHTPEINVVTPAVTYVRLVMSYRLWMMFERGSS